MARRPRPAAPPDPRRPPVTDLARAAQPAESGRVTSADGVGIAYDVYGAGDPTIVFLPSSPIVHSRQWKGQVPYFSRRHRVVTYDGRGNGRSDRPTEAAAFVDDRFVDDVAAVMDGTATGRAVLVGLCVDGVWRAIRYAAEHPERVLGIVAFAVGVPRLAPPQPHYVAAHETFERELPSYAGWQKFNRHHWREDYRDWVTFFFGEIISEPHSTKAVEDAVDWAMEATVDTMLAEADAEFPFDRDAIEAICRSVRCPMLLVHGTEDTCQHLDRARRLAELTGAPLVVIEGADHMIPGRHPVKANLLIREFVDSIAGGVP